MPQILVVDDHPLNRHFITTLLSYYGHQVTEAADGYEALDAVRRRRPDLIIADVDMPRLDGVGLVRALRADAAFAAIPVAFSSASFREDESRALAQAAGVEWVIDKPSDPELIVATVQRALGAGQPVAPWSNVRMREYVTRLQTASIRMSAILELTLELSGERDPDELLRIACRAVRVVFGANAAVITVHGGGRAVDGDLDFDRLAGRIEPLVDPEPVRATGGSQPLVAAARAAMPDIESAMLLPMTSGVEPYGWVLLAARSGSPPFSIDDERLALAAVTQIRAAHESLRAARAERQSVEEELQRSRGELAALVDASPVAIVAFDPHCVVRSWNAAAERIFGWRADEAIGMPNPAAPPHLAADFQRLSERCLRGETIYGVEQSRVHKDGARIDVIVSMAPLRDAQGGVQGFVSILDDVTDLYASRERLRALSARLLSVQEQERTRLARELHDDLGQLLTAIKLDVARLPAPHGQELLPLVDTTLDTVGRFVSDLRPSRIGEMGLAVAMERKLAELQRRTGIESTLTLPPEGLAVGGEPATAVFRILEEALTNVARHAGATRVEVTVMQNRGELVLEVRDNGRGIRMEERSASDAYGLIGMRERAVVLGGSLDVRGEEGRGTVVAARFPLETDPGDDRR